MGAGEGVGEVQGRWWPTWMGAARDGSGADDIAGWLPPLLPTCATVGSPTGPQRTQAAIPLGRVGKEAVGTLRRD